MHAEQQASLALDLHGVTVSVHSPVRHQLERLRRDFGGSALLQAQSDLQVELLPTGGEAPGTTARIRGVLGATISSGDKGRRIVIAGPSIANPDSYLVEVRPYFAAYLFDRLINLREAQKLHASAVAWEDRAFLFAGEKLAGKTTMALVSVTAGARYMANDISFVELTGEGLTVLGLPQDLTVGAATGSWLERTTPHLAEPAPEPGTAQGREADATEKRTISIDRLGRTADIERGSVPLAAIIFPESALGLSEPRARRLDYGEAVVRLASTSEATPKWDLPPTLGGDRYLERMTKIVTASASRVACWHLQWCPDHDANRALLLKLGLETFRTRV